MSRTAEVSLPLALAATLLLSLPLATSAQQAAAPPPQRQDAAVIEITATDYAFRAPDAAPSGWTTIRFTNEGEEPHFIFISRLPEGITIDDYEVDLHGVFAEAWYSVRDGRATQDQALETLFGSMPEWAASLQMIGGPGLASPGHVTESTLRLAPGTYALECYVKNADGEIHYMEGMVRPLVITGEDSGGTPPHADIRVTLSNSGMALEGDLTAGRRTFAVHVAENPEVGYGHSAHLARLDPETDLDDVIAWMDWFDLDGMAPPAPAEFLGGLHFMPEGETAYFTADLEPGRYVLLSEFTLHMGVLKEFTVD
jgi:hypothetical protein